VSGIAAQNALNADYHMIGQSPAQMLVAWRIIAEADGDVLVLNDADGPGPGAAVFQDTGANWVLGQYNDYAVIFNPAANSVSYELNGVPIFSGPRSFATTVDQIILGSDNFFAAGEIGDYDNLNHNIPEPTTLALAGAGLLGLALRRRR
jgi:hypothetical protein